MSTTMNQANHFDLHGWHLSIVYSSTSIDGKPTMTVDRNGATRSFRGDEIAIVPSPVGQLATVVLEVVPDLHTITLTLVLPTVNLDGASARVYTFATITTSRTSIGGPGLVKGQVQTYDPHRLLGSASFITP